MKSLIASLIIALAVSASAAPGKTNAVFSTLTVSNMFYTNNISISNYWTLQVSNVTYQTSNNFVLLSNMNWFTTNGAISTNIAIIVPGSLTNRIDVTNGTVRRIGVLP